jgi:ATP-dependent RNA helicase DHX8/PRP22
MDALLVVPISKVQATQRAGRAGTIRCECSVSILGRTQEGKCYRMYSEQFYKEQMSDLTVPEILRVSINMVYHQSEFIRSICRLSS